MRTNYGKEIFSTDKIKVLEIIIPIKYLIDEVKIIPTKESGLDSILLEKENLESRIFYLPYTYYKSQMEVKKNEKNKDTLKLKDVQEIKYINFGKVEKIKSDIQSEKKDIKIKDIKDIEIKLLISDLQINKEIEKDKLLNSIQEISKKIAKLMKKISEHLTEKNYIIEKIEKIKDIIDEFSKISLNDPKFIDGVTELINTKKICEEFHTLKAILIKKFELIRENYNNYKKITEDVKNDKKGISSSYKLTNKIKIVDKKLDISTFKGNNFNSPYIMLAPDNKTIQTSYPIFHFKTNSIIPSLFGNTIFSVNIFSFITKNLKAEIITDEMINKEYASLFFVPNYIQASNSITINFIIPEKKIEKEENIELNPNIKLSGSVADDVNPIIIKTRFLIQFLPLKIIIFSDKFSLSWKKDRLIINKNFIKQGHSLKINFKILNFDGNYEFLENNYTLNSLENNSVDLPSIKLDKDEKSFAKFKIDIPITGSTDETLCHGLFSFYFSNNLIIPIEINSKIKKNDFELFYYNKYTGEIQNQNSNKYINIYKYFFNKDIKNHLYFYIGYLDKEEHNLEIKVPEFNPLLSFETGILRGIKIKEGKTLDIKINIRNYNDYKEYFELMEICKDKLEIEFISDGIKKKFFINIIIEDYFAESHFDWLCSAPFYTYSNNKFIKIDFTNFNFYYRKNKYFIFHDYNFMYDFILHDDNIKYMYPKLSNLIFIIKDFYEEGYKIWGVTKDSKLEEFYESYIDVYSEPYIKKAMNEISEIYSKFNYIFSSKYENIKNSNVKYSNTIEQINELIVFVCSDNISKNTKYNLLVDLIQYFPKDVVLSNEINKLKSENDSTKLIIIYHNIIFKIGNILKKRKKRMKEFENNYFKYYAYCQHLDFMEQYRKDFDEIEFENKIKNLMANKDKFEEKEIFKDSSSKIWQFNEYSKESPISLKENPNINKKDEEIENEEISEKIRINEDILNNNKIEIDRVKSINNIIELLKKSSLLTQLFPFLIGKINNDELYKLFNNLYSIYISYKKYDKCILSEDSIKYCNLFEKICMNLIKYKVNLDDFEEIKKISLKLEDDKSQTINLFEYPKPKILNIPKDSKWFKSNKEKTKYEKINWEAGKIEKEEGEFIMKQKIRNKKENKPNKPGNLPLKPLLSKPIEITVVKPKEEELIEPEEVSDEKDLDTDEEYDIKYERETGKIEEVSKEKIEKMKFFKDDKLLTKHVINLMTRNKKIELRIPELLEDTEIKEEYFNYALLSEDKKNPEQLLLELSNIISFKLLQASINFMKLILRKFIKDHI